jgi:hypothetical protein
MSDVKSVTTCPYEGEREVRSSYLAGRLSEAEATAFEEHYLGCPLCAEAIEIGTKMRSAYGKAPVAPGVAASAATRLRWLPLAAAAAIAFAAIGVWQIARRPPDAAPTSVVRSGATTVLRVSIERSPAGDLSVSWTPISQASRYVVQVLTSDGRSLWTSESREPHRIVPAASLASANPGAALDVQVEALDAMERVIATSEPLAVPRR